MILSMTGFSSQSLTLPIDENTKVNLIISIKSLNSRYFETTCKLPYALSHIETEIIKILKKKLIRGHIYFTIYLGAQELLKGSVEPSITTIKGYLKAVDEIKNKFAIDGSLSLDTLIQMPNVFLMEEREIDSAIIEKIFHAINNCIDALIKTKQEEGAALKKDLALRISNMEKEIRVIAVAAEKLIEEQKIKV